MVSRAEPPTRQTRRPLPAPGARKAIAPTL
jgi:hypothetical protein